MIGTIQELGTSKSGKKTAKISGVGYFIDDKVDTSQWAIGKMVDFDFTLSGDKGQYKWIKTWGFAPTGTSAQAPTNGQAHTIDAAYLPFISNTVAHAIAHGLIKEPQQIRAWVQNIRAALEFADGD